MKRTSRRPDKGRLAAAVVVSMTAPAFASAYRLNFMPILLPCVQADGFASLPLTPDFYEGSEQRRKK